MTVRSTLDRPKVKPLIIGWSVGGVGPSEIVTRLKGQKINVTRQAVHGFLKRHGVEIQALGARVQEQVAVHAITSKEERIRRLDSLWDDMNEIRQSRGLMARDVKVYGTGRERTVEEIERFDAALVKEMRGVLGDVAEEMGDRTKIAIDARTQTLNTFTIQIGDGDSNKD